MPEKPAAGPSARPANSPAGVTANLGGFGSYYEGRPSGLESAPRGPGRSRAGGGCLYGARASYAVPSRPYTAPDGLGRPLGAGAKGGGARETINVDGVMD